jgi:CHRD domain
MTSRRIRFAVVTVLVLSLAGASIAVAANRGHDHGKNGPFQNAGQFQAHLIGYNEAPSINSPGQADVTISIGNNQLSFQLTYSGLTGNPSAAHVHVGQPGVNGGVSFFFCGGGGKPACPASTSGTVTGTVAQGDVQAITAQGFNAGDLNAVIAAMRAGVTYANMHTPAFPGGEIRGQLVPGHGNGHDEDD